VTESIYNNSLADHRLWSTIKTLPATLPEPRFAVRGPRSKRRHPSIKVPGPRSLGRETLTGVAEDVCLLALEVVIHFQSAFSSSHRLNGVEKSLLDGGYVNVRWEAKRFPKATCERMQSVFWGVRHTYQPLMYVPFLGRYQFFWLCSDPKRSNSAAALSLLLSFRVSRHPS